MSIIMKNNLFLNKEVNLKRIKKGLAIGLPVTIMIFVLGNHYINLIDDSLREKYQTEKIVYVDKENVLGEDVTDFSDSEDFNTEYTKWLYNEPDRIVDNYDFSDKEIKPIIQIPTYKFSSDKDVYEKSYKLSSNDTITVSCEKLKSEITPVYDVHGCDVLLNSKEVLSAWSWTDNIEISPHITIFDNEKLEYPLIVVGETGGPGSRDDLSVYKLVSGELVQLLFNSKGEMTETWFVDPYAKMYIDDNQEYLVTYFHDPAMIEKSLTRLWEVSDKGLKLVETILERNLLYNPTH